MVEEETGGRGAEHLVRTLGSRFGAALVAEPSNLEVKHGHRGTARIRLRFLGHPHHAALAAPEDNPCWALAVAKRKTDPLLGAAADTRSQNRTPGEIELIFDWRTVGECPEEMKASLPSSPAGFRSK